MLLQCRGGDLPEFLARKLEISTVLNGHTGCVNRLAWNQDGSLLASASDDCQVGCPHERLPQLRLGPLQGVLTVPGPWASPFKNDQQLPCCL